MAKMGWKRVCRLKVKGEFGISNHEFKNQAILSKWWWDFAKEPNSLCRKVLISKYGTNLFKWRHSTVGLKKMSDILHCIIGVANEDLVYKFLERDCFRWVVGNGTNVLFWYDVWCNDLPLKNFFLRFFCPANNKMVKVVDYSVNQSFIHDGWRDFFFLPLLYREVSLLDDLCDLIKLIAVDLEMCDRII
ncbi:hypothetical protein PVK06_023997 [Gossypium arboreum]|uniref:RNA-directed DNA polymerase, eukaryota, Reverse transcriptase zinc-binding domain protein n=1 Tax=Gossypium arboreum TaxID=29729 RepID=A0ABR0PCV4_GOSAR|nr:hypothetical protein PVK06_023997 [Gossypium arboreum]